MTPPPTSPNLAGWLARALLAADYNLRDVERQVENFLTSLFPDGWKGWAFERHGREVAIDIYEATESPAAAAALHRAGFAHVTVHLHEPSKFITCACRTHSTEAP